MNEIANNRSYWIGNHKQGTRPLNNPEAMNCALQFTAELWFNPLPTVEFHSDNLIHSQLKSKDLKEKSWRVKFLIRIEFNVHYYYYFMTN